MGDAGQVGQQTCCLLLSIIFLLFLAFMAWANQCAPEHDRFRRSAQNFRAIFETGSCWHRSDYREGNVLDGQRDLSARFWVIQTPLTRHALQRSVASEDWGVPPGRLQHRKWMSETPKIVILFSAVLDENFPAEGSLWARLTVSNRHYQKTRNDQLYRLFWQGCFSESYRMSKELNYQAKSR